MAHIAEFTLSVRAFPGGHTLSAEELDVRVEVERFIPSGESLMPFFWVWGDDVDAFLDATERDESLSDVTVLHRVENGALYRATWAHDGDVVEVLRSLDATILDAVGTSASWFVRLRAQTYQPFASFHDAFEAEGADVELEKLYELPADSEGHYYRLTPDQRETIVTAYEDGYFDEPRGTTQQELGAKFDVSGRAISTRLRRGLKSLVANTLLTSTGSQGPGSR
ncbi:bacterio-opsin activator domain-containing protein [Salinigranum sp.]|uniref:helix-turn-helix domain-containing protein n=1 Tax=Salinigranum sp. TaxID=1966351 RepID=UPI003562FE43